MNNLPGKIATTVVLASVNGLIAQKGIKQVYKIVEHSKDEDLSSKKKALRLAKDYAKAGALVILSAGCVLGTLVTWEVRPFNNH